LTCAWAAKYGQLDCLKYAVEHDCPCDASARQRATENNHQECVDYLISKNL